MRILVMGKNGQVGHEFARFSQPHFETVLVGREDCDLSLESSVRNLIRQVKPGVIVNAAAYTAVDQAEKEPDLCFAVNAAAPRILAEEAARLDALLIHYSTDYVFSGEKEGPYGESDATGPLNVYGASKAAGEAAIAAQGARHLVLRTSWVYSAHGKNFFRTMLHLAAERDELRVVDDQIGAPTSAAAIAAATATLVERYASPAVSCPSGVYHMTAGGATSWCGFARAIVSAGADLRKTGVLEKPRVLAISTAEYPTPARRPRNSVLSNDKFESAFGFRLSPWEKQLDQLLATLSVANRFSR